MDHIEAKSIGDILNLKIISTALNDFDLAHATADEIESSISKWDSDKVILSLKNVDYVTSVGLIIFARLISFVKKNGSRLVLCDAKEMVEEVLRLSRVVAGERKGIGLPLETDYESALAKLQ